MRFIIGFLVTIGLLIFVFVLIFRGGGNNQAPQTKLVDYADTSVVMQMTQVGQVSADQTHKEVRITVTSVETSIEIFNGYQHDLALSKTYTNNSTAYADFLRALQIAGYTNGSTDKNLADERGFCADGVRYIMGIKDGDHDIQRFWSSSCGGTASFKGKTNAVRNLFIKQVPDYDVVAANIF